MGLAAEGVTVPEIVVRPLDVLSEGTWMWNKAEPSWNGSTFDPFPAYPHDVQLVEETARRVAELCPSLWDVEFVLADREETSRTNAHSQTEHHGHYDGDDWVKDPPSGQIVLAGKRIPPHPGMTRHLVAHEYGHQVQRMLTHRRDRPHLEDDAILRDYATVRGLPESSIRYGSGGGWHGAIGEIFACDFRILVCGLENEYWPHPGIARPETVPGLDAWWDAAVQEVRGADIPAEPEKM